MKDHIKQRKYFQSKYKINKKIRFPLNTKNPYYIKSEKYLFEDLFDINSIYDE